MDPFSICDGMNIYIKVKEEAEDFIELSHEFKAEPGESTGEAELENVPWMKQECGNSYKVTVKQEWSEVDSDAALKRRFGCKRELVVRIERLDKWTHCSPVNFEGGRQLLKQIHSLAYPAWDSDAGGTSRSSWLSSSEAPVRDGKDSVSGQEIGQDLNEPHMKTAAVTDSTCNVQVQKLDSDIHLGIHSTESQQKNLLASSQEADEAVAVQFDEDLHSESSRNSVMDSVKCQNAAMPYPSLAADADKSHLTEHACQTTKTINEISAVSSDDCNADEKPFKYSVCQRTVTGKSNLSRLNDIHIGQKLFECGVCRKNFSRKSNLTLHVRVHTGEKPFECSVCKKNFSRKSNLTLHGRIHTGEKPFECSVCRKKFTDKSHLNSHVRIHTGEKPFECGVCRKKFTQKSHLTYHIAIHTSEKPFKCSVCRRKFTWKSHLTRHLRLHTGKNYLNTFYGEKIPLKSEV